MADRNAFKWFKTTFHNEIEQALVGTPFSLDLIAAIAAQETGHIWGPLHDKLEVEQLLEICVGDTLDADGGRRAFPKLKADLLAVTRGDEMFRIAHEALVAMAEHVPSFTKVAKRPDKFCHGYGIFQYDIQFFRTNPDYFLTREWRRFTSSLEQCIEELRSALKRVEGTRGKTALSDLEQAHVAIACNTGSFKPAKGLKQGFFDGSKFYGEMIFDFLRLSETVSIPELPARLPEAPPGTAPIARPMPVRAEGPVLQVDVRDAPLRLRSKPFVDRQDPNANVIARLPDGQLVRLVAGTLGDKFVEVETSLNGAHFRGFAASEFLIAASDTAEVRVAVPAAAPPTSGIVAVFGPARPGVVTRRANPASAQSLNEPGQPGRRGTTPEELRGEINAIIDYLAVDKPAHVRYQPSNGHTFCNIYTHDYCFLAGVYLPRVWWTPDAIERLARGESVEPRLGNTIDEQRANDLFRWLRAFGMRFGWRQTSTLTKLQTEANIGAVALIVARVEDGKSGHITVVVPETTDVKARRDASGEVIAPLQSQAGSRNFRRGTGSLNWFKDERFADSAFWIHA